VDEVDYYECLGCDCIFADRSVIEKIDSGVSVQTYQAGYWEEEVASSFERCYGPAIARVAEVLLCARTPVHRFLDIGTGGGYLLDALFAYLPGSKNIFHGIEMFPPPQVTSHPGFKVGKVGDLDGTFQAGSCIEVLEHLTPHMVRGLAQQLAEKSSPKALYIFNTGLTEYVRNEDRGYLDPYRRGHIVSYSVRSAARLFEPFGFKIIPCPGKTWAFFAEYESDYKEGDNFVARIWSPIPENLRTMTDPTMGSVMAILGRESIRAYLQ
jgi:hypothetical protein